MAKAFAEIAFTPTVRAMQTKHGSADAYYKFLAPEAERGDRLTEREASFITARDGFYQATVSEAGWPYVQFRGGPAGFLKVLDGKTIAFADFRGNRQYISSGNLKANDRIALILMDYPNRRRLKIWGRAKLIDAKDDPALIDTLREEGYRALPERAVIITVEAVDWNCPQHIPQRFTLDEIDRGLEQLRAENVQLRQETTRLREQIARQQAVSTTIGVS